MLVRENYLKRLRPFYELDSLIKVVTGMRRSGKSVLLGQVAQDIRSRRPDAAVVELNFELGEYAFVDGPETLERLVLERLGDSRGRPGYAILDEVQLVPDFETAVNSLRTRGGVSVFISGSNASLFSDELATRLAGRYVEFQVWPLTYRESLEMRGVPAGASTSDLLRDYLVWGGLPMRFALPGDAERRAYLDDVFNSVVLRDVVQRVGIRDVPLFQSIVEFAVENLGRTLSPSSLARYLAGRGRTIAADTIYSYLRALTGALLFHRVRRFDVRGKSVLATLDKYYATDLGMVASKHVGSGPGWGDRLENAVFAELAGRGFEVFTGLAGKREIDFVAVKGGTPRYVQVAYLLATSEVEEREFGAFASVPDNYPRFVVSADPLTRDRDGVRHLGLEEFLLAPPPDLE